MVYVKKNIVGKNIYVQVVECKRIGKKVIQNFICSLGEINLLITKLQKMRK